MKTLLARALALLLLVTATALHAQVPQLLNYQGRVAIGAVNFNGSGSFKFALVNTNGSTTYWSNDGTSTAGSQPTAAVTLAVTNGLYSALLGDTTITNMTAIPASVWTNADVRLRVWFNDGADGWQLLTPDQRLAPNGYLPNGAVSSATLASGAVSAANIAPGSIGTTQLAGGTLSAPVSVTGTTQTVVSNTAYTATSTSNTAFTPPLTANVGDVVQITGVGSGGWSVPAGALAWTAQSGAPSARWYSVASSADGSHLVAAVQNGQIYTSTNFGVTWTAQSGAPSANWYSVASSADGTHLVAVVQGGQIYTSPDSGVTWTAQSGAPDSNSNVYWQSVASSADGTHLVALDGFGKIYTSPDSGVTWTAQSGAPSTNWWSVASSADGTHLVAVAYGGQIYTSSDSGVTWTAQSGAPTTNWYSVASSADGTHLIAGDLGTPVNGHLNGRLYTSPDSGVTWTAQNGAPAVGWTAVASSADGTHLVAAVAGGQIYSSTNSGVTWTVQNGPPGANWNSVASSADGAHVVAVTLGGQIYTEAQSILSGAQGSTVTLQYTRYGWQANEAWLANGANLYYNAGNVGIGTSTPANPLSMGSGAYCSAAGVWTNVSDRNVKEAFTPISPGEVLARVAALPITQWKYKVEPDGIKHLGPVAQDFHAAFGLGDSDRAIGSVDETGVALAAIQGLNQKLEAKDAEIAELKKQLAELEAKDKEREARISRLENLLPPATLPTAAKTAANLNGD